MATMSTQMLDNLKKVAKTAHDAIEKAKLDLAAIKKMEEATKSEAAVGTAAADDAARKREIDNLKVAVTKEEDYKKVREKVTKLMGDAAKVAKAVAVELEQGKKLGLLPKGLVHVDAVGEIGSDAKIIADVKKVFEKTAGGRTAPGTSGVNHIHVSGDGSLNLLFDTGNQMVLGIVHGHIDSENKDAVKQSIKVSGRKGGSSKKMRIVDGKLVEIPKA